jgi:uncharacterized protein (TIGR00266 family)
MRFEIKYRPGYALALCRLEPGEKVLAEAGAMVTQDVHVQMETSASGGKGVGGLLKSLGRSMLGGESFFRNTFTAGTGPGEVSFAPSLPGDMFVYDMKGQDLMVQGSAYVASSPSVEVDAKFGGLKSLMGQGKIFWLKASGTGPLVLNAFGAVKEMLVDGAFVIDTGHVVAFESGLNFKITRAGSWFTTFFSGEGLVCRFEGKGKVYLQSRNPSAFGQLIGPKLPKRG